MHPNRLAAAATAAIASVAACGTPGNAATPPATGVTTPRPAAPAGGPAATAGAGTAQSAPQQYVVTLANDGAGSRLRFLRPDGHWPASYLMTGPEDSAAAFRGGALIAHDGRVLRFTPDGTVKDVGAIDSGTPYFVASPDGTRWVWTSLDTAGTTVTLRLAGDGVQPHALYSRPAGSDPGQLGGMMPLSWTSDGLIVADQPMGIGCGGAMCAFGDDGYNVDAWRIGPATGARTQLAGSSCRFGDAAAGIVACIVEGAQQRIRASGDGAHVDLPAPAGWDQAGILKLSPDGSTLAFGLGSAAGSDGMSVRCATDVVDVHTGGIRRLADGYVPVAWLDATHLVADSLNFNSASNLAIMDLTTGHVSPIPAKVHQSVSGTFTAR